MREFRLRLAQRLFSVICANRCSNVGADASIAQKLAICVKKGFAACLKVYRGSSLACSAVHEIAKWQMCVEHRPMQSPFFGFCFDVACNIPASHPGQA